MIKKKLITLTDELERRFNDTLHKWKSHSGDKDQIRFVQLVLETGLTAIEYMVKEDDQCTPST